MAKPNVLDRAIAWMAPERGLARMQARAAADMVMRYEAARASRRTRGWVVPTTDAPSAARADIARLRDVSRDLVRNNAWAHRGVGVVANNTIGAGIIPQFKRADQAPVADLEALARLWADTSACDADGNHDLYGLQLLAMRCIVESGEVIIRRRDRRGSDGLPIPMQLQVLEPDHLDATFDGVAPGSNNPIRQGIEFNSIGKRVAYWLYRDHPGSRYGSMSFTERSRVPADQVIHAFRVDRPGQIRGIPWLAPVALRLNDFRDYEDAQLVRQKIAACYAAFVHAPIDEEGPAATTTPAGETEDLQRSFEPGMIEQLPPGWDVKFGQPPTVDGYGEYSTVTLRAIAAGLNVSYEALSGDLSSVNFSSARMGWLEFQRNIDVWRWDMLAPLMLHTLGRWFLDAASFQGVDTDDVTVTWTPPRREMISPRDEVPALKEMLRAGLTSRSEVIRSYGYDPLSVLDEIAADRKAASERGLRFDTDTAEPSRPAPSQPSPPESGDGDPSHDGN